jgi:hypothetical protein
MNKWLVEAQNEIADLQRRAQAEPKAFYGTAKGRPDTPDTRRVEHLAAELEDLARKARGLVRS